MKRWILAALIAAATLGGAPARAAEITLGGLPVSGGGDCVPFGCSLRVQQSYAASLFSGPGMITAITFFHTENAGFDSGAITGSNFTFTLSSGGSGALSATFADNIGPDATVVFNGPLAGPIGSSFTVTLDTPFFYDPIVGALVLDVLKPDGANDFGLFLDYTDSFAGINRVYDFDGQPFGFVQENYGLVTGFNIAPVPTPAAWTLFAAGLLGLTLVGRRRAAHARHDG